MSVGCPKCSYVRQETDEAPDWQCPKCGIAIAKYIALQKEAAEREAAKRNPPVQFPERQMDKPRPALGLSDGTGSEILQKLVYWIAALGAAALVRYLFSAPSVEQHVPPRQVAQTGPFFQQDAPQPVARGASLVQGPPVPQSPDLPVDLFKEQFAQAHREGTANAVMNVTNVRGMPSLNRLKPVDVLVERREALASPGCDRFGVTLTQGGGQHLNQRGEFVQSAYSMYFVYSLNYCSDGTQPAGGNDIKIEARQ